MTLPEVNPEILKRLDDYLTSQGLCRTRQRDVIVRAAFSTTEHFNADELWERAKSFDKTTSRAASTPLLGNNSFNASPDVSSPR